MKLTSSESASARLLNIASDVISPPRSLYQRIAFIYNTSVTPGAPQLQQVIRSGKKNITVRSGQHIIHIRKTNATGHYRISIIAVNENKGINREVRVRDEIIHYARQLRKELCIENMLAVKLLTKGRVNLNKCIFDHAALNGKNLAGCSLVKARFEKANMTNINLEYSRLEHSWLVKANLKNANMHHTCLKKANLSGADLSGVDLSDADLSNAYLIGTNLTGANLNGTNLTGANLSGTNLNQLNMSSAILNNADLREKDLSRTNLSRAHLSGVDLRGSDLRKADLHGADLRGANLQGADLRSANLNDADLRDANLNTANLTGAYLSGTDLQWTNLCGAIMSRTNLRCANLSGAILTGVNLSGNELSGAILIDTDLSGKNLRGVDLCGAKLRGVNLSRADLCEANLSGTDLSSGNLHNTNLSGTNINGANLRNTKLIDANLIGAHLRGSDLKWANLSGAILSRTSLRSANLSGTNLTDVNLRGNELSGAILIDVDLSGKNLRGIDLSGADLSFANLIGADLSLANLSCANLSNTSLYRTKLSGANLSGTELSGLSLNGFDLSGTNLSGTDLSGKDLRNTNLSGANLSSTDLSGTDLSDTNLSGANINGANLSYANLRKADLIGAYLSGANLHEADLRDADLENIDLRGISLKNTQLDNALLTIYSMSGADLRNINLERVSIKLLPAEISWNDRNVDRLINHHNNAGGSLLTTLRSIDDRHNNLKVKLAHELMRSLSSAGYTPAKLVPVALPLLEVLGQAPYTDDSALAAWLGSVAEARLAERGTEGMTPAIAGSLLFPFEREIRLAVRQSAGLIQLVHVALDSGEPALAGRAEALYARYLALPKIAPYTRSAPFDRLNPEFPDEPARVSLAERNEINLVLLPATPGGPVMLLSRDALDDMLHPDPTQPAWDHFCLMDTPEHARPVAAVNPERLFRHDFPLFLSPFLTEQNKSAFARLLDTLDLKAYRADFDAALRSRSSEQKLTSDRAQTDLHALFSHVLRPDENWGRLTAEHTARVLRAFRLEAAPQREQAQYFLCLSALFARLSSSAYFGSEYESPVTLRVYAHALMLEAAELDGSVFTAEQLSDWQNRFQKRSGAFDCTAVLSDIMTSHVRQTCLAVLAGIRPAAWT